MQHGARRRRSARAADGWSDIFRFSSILASPPRISANEAFLARVSELGMSIQNVHTNWHDVAEFIGVFWKIRRKIIFKLIHLRGGAHMLCKVA